MRVSQRNCFGASIASKDAKVVTGLTEQLYGAYNSPRGILGKASLLLKSWRQNPRGTILRGLKPTVKLGICTYLATTFFVTCYKMRLDPPWERFYREQSTNKK